MECYFGTYERSSPDRDCKSSVVMFHIPDVGIRFKAPFDAVNRDHCDLASLLALLEFIDSNQKYFSRQACQIFGTNLSVINQMNGKEGVPPMFSNLMEKASKYRQKYRFSLAWVPRDENSAMEQLFD